MFQKRRSERRLSTNKTAKDFRLAKWTVIPGENIVKNSQAIVQLEEKVMQVLCYLANANGRVVSREELFQEIWPGVIVTEESLTRCISKLRKVLDDNKRNPQIIKTISKKGYKLLVPVKRKNAIHHSLAIRMGVTVGLMVVVFVFTFLSKNRSEHRWYSNHPDWVTSFGGREIFPNPSPVDNRIAFSWDGGVAKNWDIYLKDTKGEVQRLTTHPGREQGSAWSPDGQQIAYIRNDQEVSSILLMSSSGGEPEQLVTRTITNHSTLTWSSDGEKIAYVDGEHNAAAYGIYDYALESRTKSKLAIPDSEELAYYNPMYSPDGKYLSFLSITGTGKFGIKLLDLKTGDIQLLEHIGSPISGHSWSMDAQHILFSVQGDLESRVHKVSLNTGEMSELGISGSYPRYAHKSHKILAEQRRMFNDIWLLKSEDGVAVPIMAASSSKDDVVPSLNPDATHLAFASNRNGQYEVYMYDLETTSLAQFTKINASYINGISWSPNGRHVAVNSFHNGEQAKIVIFEVESGKVWKEIHSGAEKMFPSWSPNGDAVFYTVKTGTGWDLWRCDLSNDLQELVVRNGFIASTIDGKEIFYLNSQTEQVWKINLNEPGRKPSPVSRNSYKNLSYRFVNNFVTYIDQVGAEVSFIKSTPGKDQVLTIGKINSRDKVTDFDADIDNKLVVFTVNSQSESDLVMYSALAKENTSP